MGWKWNIESHTSERFIKGRKMKLDLKHKKIEEEERKREYGEKIKEMQIGQCKAKK